MEEPSRFTAQANQYWASADSCPRSLFYKYVGDDCVNWKITLRQQIEAAVARHLPLDAFARYTDFQKFCLRQLSKPVAGPAFQQLTLAERLLKWAHELKESLPAFIFAVADFGLVPRTDKNGHPRLDAQGRPMLYRRRKQENIVHLSGLFMADYDKLPFPPREVYELTRRKALPWHLCLAHATSSGHGCRLVCEALPGMGNIADQQFLLARELGLLNVIGTTGSPVCDNSCINADRISYCPRREDIYFIDEERLFNY